MRKSISLFLALVMLAGTLAACGETPPPSETTGDVTVTTDSPVTTESKETPDIPLTGDYEGYEFNILSIGNAEFNDFDFEEESSVALDNAQYKRKLKVEQDYNIKIVATVQKKHSTGAGPGYIAVTKQNTAGDNDYDLCNIAGYDVTTLAYSSQLYDLNAVEEINLSKSYWDQNAVDSLSVRGVTFFTTGEISIYDNYAAFCILFNRELFKEYNLESPYEMVEDGTWTIENFGKLVKTVSEDLNQDGQWTDADRYGLLVWDDSILGMVNAAGERCCTINPDSGEIELTLYNEATLSALEQYADIAYDQQHSICWQRVAGSSSGIGDVMWQANQGLFNTRRVDMLPKYREMEADFGILPYPKLTETQENYYTTIAPYTSCFFCIPAYQEDISRTGVITEALAYYGKEIVTPALYDVTLVGQSTRDEESEPMLDIIFENIVYDIGWYYQIGTYNERIMDRLRSYNKDFTSMYDTYKNSAVAKLKTINANYAKAVEKWAEQ